MSENFSEEEADKALRPKINVLYDASIEGEDNFFRDRPSARTNIPDQTMIQSIKWFYYRHARRRRNEYEKALEKPRFGVRLRSIDQTSILLRVINDIQTAMCEDVAFYYEMVDITLKNLRTLRDKPTTLVKDMSHALLQSSLPMEMRVILRSSLGMSLTRIVREINNVIHYLEEVHNEHRILLDSFINLSKKALTALFAFGRTKKREGPFGIRSAIIRHLAPLAAPINRFLQKNNNFAGHLEQQYSLLALQLDGIQQTRNSLQRNFIGRISHYKHPEILIRIRTAMQFDLWNEMLETEDGIMTALFRLEHMCRSLRDI